MTLALRPVTATTNALSPIKMLAFERLTIHHTRRPPSGRNDCQYAPQPIALVGQAGKTSPSFSVHGCTSESDTSN